MGDVQRGDFVGRHLIIDASTSNRRNLTSTDTVFTLLEALARNLDMTLVLPRHGRHRENFGRYFREKMAWPWSTTSKVDSRRSALH